MDPYFFASLLWMMFGVVVLVAAALALFRAIRSHRQGQQLDRESQTATGQVSTVGALGRDEEEAAGNLVAVSSHITATGLQPAQHHTGLSGYLAREGTGAVAWQAPTDPRQVRVEQPVGPAVPYPGARTGRPGGALLLPAVGVLSGAAVAAEFASELFGYRSPIATSIAHSPLWGTLFLTIVGVAILAGVSVRAVRLARTRRRLQGQALAVVTDTWTHRIGGWGQRVYPFTVYFAVPDGREVHARNPTASHAFRPQPQQRVPLRYDPSHPARFEVPAARDTLAYVVLPVLGGIQLVMIGTVATIVGAG